MVFRRPLFGAINSVAISRVRAPGNAENLAVGRVDRSLKLRIDIAKPRQGPPRSLDGVLGAYPVG